ncbi:MAG: HEAT repeat domain-containing protein [Acidobacteria bacterium]|nr:HEAT repeat domain-containing protein [Acidobacteriota bacterium]
MITQLSALGCRLSALSSQLSALGFRACLLALTAAAANLATADATVAQGRIDNARIETRNVARALEREIAALGARGEVFWVGYRVPLVAGRRQMCCYDALSDAGACCGRCRLEAGGEITMSTDEVNASAGSRVTIEPPADFLVLARIADGQVGRLRTFTPDCDVDAGGRPVVWLNGVTADDSVSWLTTLAMSVSDLSDGERHRRVAKPAIAAIALHDAPAADRALESFVTATRPDWMRGDTTFWLGSARGDNGLRVLTRVIAEDPSEKVREKAVFGLSVSKSRAALPALIATASDDSNARVRSRALFWLAQKAGRQAAAAISHAIANDPDTEVKKKAVFALSQMPKDEGIPKLIEVARTNRNPEVRKQAMFWLGQSKDARAVQFFAEILAAK